MAFVVVDGFFHFAQQHGGGLQLMVVDHGEGLAAMGGTMGKIMQDLGFEVIRRHSSRFWVVKERPVTDIGKYLPNMEDLYEALKINMITSSHYLFSILLCQVCQVYYTNNTRI